MFSHEYMVRASVPASLHQPRPVSLIEVGQGSRVYTFLLCLGGIELQYLPLVLTVSV
jgi:hypothetical protein